MSGSWANGACDESKLLFMKSGNLFHLIQPGEVLLPTCISQVSQV